MSLHLVVRLRQNLLDLLDSAIKTDSCRLSSEVKPKGVGDRVSTARCRAKVKEERSVEEDARVVVPALEDVGLELEERHVGRLLNSQIVGHILPEGELQKVGAMPNRQPEARIKPTVRYAPVPLRSVVQWWSRGKCWRRRSSKVTSRSWT